MAFPQLTFLLAALAVASASLVNVAHGQSAGLTIPASPAEPAFWNRTTDAAWKVFQAGDYSSAITQADQCISRYKEIADRIQLILQTNNINLPTGQVANVDERRVL